MSIPSLKLTTASLPEREQFDGWARHSRNTELTQLRPGPFLADGTIWDLGSASLSQVRLDPFMSDRKPAAVAATAADFVQLVALRRGEVRFEAEGIDHACEAPDLFVRDYAQPSRATSTAIDAVVLYLARPFLEETAGPIVYQGRLPLSPEVALIGATLNAMVERLGDAAPSSAGIYARTLRDLLAAALIRHPLVAGSPRGSAHAAPDRTAARLRDAKDYMAVQVPGTLSAAKMARELGLSRSALYGLFRRHGGVMAYDRLRRLRALYRHLGDMTDSRTIARIGEAHGFADKSALSHAFRRTFGCSLSDVRRRSTEAHSSGTPADHIRELVDRLA